MRLRYDVLMTVGGPWWRLGYVVAILLSSSGRARAQAPTLEQTLSYPFVSGLVRSERGDRLAWVTTVRGVRTVWVAAAAGGAPRKVAGTGEDDGQEITGLAFTPDGKRLLYVRGGDHDGNWSAEGNLAPNPASSTIQPKVTIWLTEAGETAGAAAPVIVAEGDAAVVSHTGQVVYIKDGQVWTVALPPERQEETAHKAERLFFDRGQDDGLVWSPDGRRLAFVSNRGDHSFIGLWEKGQSKLRYLAPSTNLDGDPTWSSDGREVAWIRRPGTGGEPHNFMTEQVLPFSLWTASVETGEARQVWQAPDTAAGNLPDLAEQEPLLWMANGQLVFLAETDGWPHLWRVDAKQGSQAKLLTPGSFMVEDVAMSPDRRSLVYSANSGTTPGDNERRHLYRLRADETSPTTLTKGEGLEWTPVALADGRVAMVQAGAQQTPRIAIQTGAGAAEVLETGEAKSYPQKALLKPQAVRWKAPDGLEIEGQLFRSPKTNSKQPGLIFVHGGPTRQMLLGWHMMDFYTQMYAMNQWFALHGFTVLSINYRLGIGYGRAFQDPEHAGPAGASEYQDVLSGARFLQSFAGVDPSRIGIYGASYGGYLTGLALARDSDVFKAGVDAAGLWNWLPAYEKYGALPEHWWQVDAGWQDAVRTALSSSPAAAAASWRSPVLLIQGDDDRNVLFDQTVTAAYALKQRGVDVEEFVLPNENHTFLRWRSIVDADQKTYEFLCNRLRADSH